MSQEHARVLLDVANQRDRDARGHGLKGAGAGLVGAAGLGGAVAANNRIEHHFTMAQYEHGAGAAERVAGRAKSVNRLGHLRRLGVGTALAAAPVFAYQGYKQARARNDSAILRRKALETAVAKSWRQELAKADSPELPGDNRQAQMARTRRKVGLGTAGAGYLVASRHKDVAPGIAEWLAPSARKVGETQRLASIAGRTKKISGAAVKGGAAGVIGGLALAGEGTVSDFHHRKSLSRGHSNVRHALRPRAKADEPTPVLAKGWGALASDALHAFKPVGAALEGGAAGPGLVARLKPLAPKLGTQISDTVQPIKAKIAAGGLKPFSTAADGTKSLSTAGVGYLAGAGGVGAGVLANRQMSKSARDAVLVKAFDAERSRHNRQAAYTGTLAGGAIVAGAHGVNNELAARPVRAAQVKETTAAANKHLDLQRQLQARKGSVNLAHPSRVPPAQSSSALLHRQALGHTSAAVTLGEKAKKLTRISRGSLAGAGVLGAAAYGVHNYDRRHGGRSHGYGY